MHSSWALTPFWGVFQGKGKDLCIEIEIFILTTLVTM